MGGRAAASLAALAATLIVGLPAPALGWGSTGHRIVAELAQARLSPAARAEVARIAGERPLAQLSTWPDYVRAEREWEFADPWHYVTVGVGQPAEEALAVTPVVGPAGA
ncbi:MAG: S1/P1 nuclease, partial [Thermoanaerobaculia bacterium]|nr:S1/P1 nuclease [Thermoanaerobaculia bacterium]